MRHEGDKSEFMMSPILSVAREEACSPGSRAMFTLLIAQWVKNLPAVQETQVTQIQSLGREDPLEEEMATRSSILVWEMPWTEEPIGLHGFQRVRHD